MPDGTEAGQIFIREGARLPDGMPLDSEPYMPGWRLVKNLDAYGLDRRIHEAGWTFFCLAGRMQAAFFGRETPAKVHKAVKRILAARKSAEFNSVEITEVVPKRFLGLPRVTVFARSRHIQESVFLSNSEDSRGLGSSEVAAVPGGHESQREDALTHAA